MKQKRSRRWMWLLCTVVAAVAGAALRRWQLTTAFEGELELPIPMAPASVALVCVLVIGAALLMILAVTQKEVPLPRNARTGAMIAPKDFTCLTLTVMAAVLAFAAAPSLLMQGVRLRNRFQAVGSGNNGLLLMFTAVTAVAACIGLVLAAQARYRGIGRSKGEAMIALPAINSCLWLMEHYRSHAADPVLWDYVPMLLAIIGGMLFYMECAGLAVGAPYTRRTLWLAGMTVILSVVSLAGIWDTGSALLLMSQTLAALAVLWRLPLNVEYPPAAEPAVGPDRDQEIQEEHGNV